jgi:hypothetical protein
MKKVLDWMALFWAAFVVNTRTVVSQLSHSRPIAPALSCKRRASRFLAICRGCLLALILVFWGVGAHAQTPHYRYVSLDQIPLPTGYTRSFYGALQDGGRVYGTICDTFLCNVNEFVYVPKTER